MQFTLLVLVLQVHLIFDMREKYACSLLGSADCLTHVHALLRTLIATRDAGQNADGKSQACNVVSKEVDICHIIKSSMFCQLSAKSCS